MSTKKPRINITLEETTAKLLATLAYREDKSVAGLSKELIMEALMYREDVVLSSIGDARDVKKAKRVKHANAWK